MHLPISPWTDLSHIGPRLSHVISCECDRLLQSVQHRWFCSLRTTEPSSLHIRISMGCSTDICIMMLLYRCSWVFNVHMTLCNGVGMGTTRVVTGGDGDTMQQTVRERVGDVDKNIFCGAVMGSSTCPCVIFCYGVKFHLFALKLDVLVWLTSCA